MLIIAEAEVDPFPHLKNGVFVEVRCGPAKGLRGLVTGRTHEDRIILQVDALGQTVSMVFAAAVLGVVE